MNTIRRHWVVVVRWTLAAFLSGQPSLAQGWIRSFEGNIWDGDRQILILNPGNTYPGRIMSREGKLIERIPAPGAFATSKDQGPDGTTGDKLAYPGRIDFSEGKFFCFQSSGITWGREGAESESRLLIWEQNSWKELAKLPLKGGLPPIRLWRLGNGKFLGVASTRGTFVSMGRSYPFGILRINQKNQLVVDSCMDLDLEKVQFPEGRKGQTYGGLLQTFLTGASTRTENHIVFASVLGLFWIFDAETGHLKRTARLYPGLTDRMLEGREQLMPGLLGFGVRPEGQLVLSARPEDAVLTTFKLSPYPTAGDPQGKELLDLNHRLNTIIDWWALDPMDGKFTMIAPPDNFPSSIRNENEFRNFNWRFKPDGRNLQLINFDEFRGVEKNSQ